MATTDHAPAPLEQELDAHRRALTGFCYRMLGSGFEAEDAVQETLVRAWRSSDRLEAREAMKSWLYRIATNVCLDMLKSAQRRARPMDLGGPRGADDDLGGLLPENVWVLPVADARALHETADPAELAAERETIRLAFVAALQHLPPRQRVVLILREVLHWQAAEVAELLGTTTASVNSALQRARATLDAVAPEAQPAAAGLDEEHEALLARYVETFERYDVDAFVSLLRDDAAFTMPPFPLWLRGPEAVGRFMLGQGAACRGSKLIATSANGRPAFGSYKPGATGRREPWSLQVLEFDGGRIAEMHNFLDTRLFEAFGLPPYVD